MKLEDLGRRAVACKHWRWMPGMRSFVGPGRAPYRYITNEYAPPEGDDVGFSDPIVPDLSDPATLGCLLHLVREAWGDADLSADRVSRAHDKLPDIWQVYVFHERGVKDVLSGRSEVEALVAALGAAS